MNDRLYLDYNSTSPLAKSVIDFLAKGDFPFANPSSLHKSGKHSRKLINQVTNQIFNTFEIDPKKFNLIYHSGATEFINTFFQFEDEDAFIYSPADHKASQMQGHKCKYSYPMKVNEYGLIEEKYLISLINEHREKFPKGRVLINFQWVNSETGIIQDLTLIDRIKGTNIFIHVDAVQAPGKLKHWRSLVESADAYTFSAHKFGALKSSGFSFCRKSHPLNPLLLGGGQQDKLRAGTENPMNVLSIGQALDDLKSYPLMDIQNLKIKILKLIDKNKNLEIIGSVENTSVNTIMFIDKNNKADGNLIKFDMQGMDISSGSACTAGSIEPSDALLAMGHDEYAKNGLRISLGPANIKDQSEILNRLEKVIGTL